MPTVIEPLPLNRWTEWGALLRAGWPPGVTIIPEKALWRFYNKISLSDSPDGCWLWKAYPTREGYGLFSLNGVRITAHRVSVYISGRHIRRGHVACHHCDNRLCMRPDHIFTGTYRDNSLDMSRKGRSPGHAHPESVRRGTQVNTAKLDDNKVREMIGLHTAGWSIRQLEQRFGLTETPVRNIVLGNAWSHIERGAA